MTYENQAAPNYGNPNQQTQQQPQAQANMQQAPQGGNPYAASVMQQTEALKSFENAEGRGSGDYSFYPRDGYIIQARDFQFGDTEIRILPSSDTNDRGKIMATSGVHWVPNMEGKKRVYQCLRKMENEPFENCPTCLLVEELKQREFDKPTPERKWDMINAIKRKVQIWMQVLYLPNLNTHNLADKAGNVDFWPRVWNPAFPGMWNEIAEAFGHVDFTDLQHGHNWVVNRFTEKGKNRFTGSLAPNQSQLPQELLRFIDPTSPDCKLLNLESLVPNYPVADIEKAIAWLRGAPANNSAGAYEQQHVAPQQGYAPPQQGYAPPQQQHQSVAPQQQPNALPQGYVPPQQAQQPSYAQPQVDNTPPSNIDEDSIPF